MVLLSLVRFSWMKGAAQVGCLCLFLNSSHSLQQNPEIFVLIRDGMPGDQKAPTHRQGLGHFSHQNANSFHLGTSELCIFTKGQNLKERAQKTPFTSV